MRSINKLVLAGDSSLDNRAWVKEGQAVVDILKRRLSRIEIHDLANDGFTTKDVLEGAYRNKVFLFNPSKYHPREMFKPLEVLGQMTEVDCCFLSVGGNDVREQLGSLFNKTREEQNQLLDTIIAKFSENYQKILQILEAKKIKPIIVLQYLPSCQNDKYKIYSLMQSLASAHSLEDGIQHLQLLMKRVYAPILRIAQKKGFPIIDLSSSLNCRNPKLYESQIEPSASGGEIIANLMAHVVEHHDFNSESKLYATPDISQQVVVISTDAENWRPHFQQPEKEEEALQMFEKVYEHSIRQNQAGFFGGLFARRRSLEIMPESLEALSTHAGTKGKQTKALLKEMGWMNENDQITLEFKSI